MRSIFILLLLLCAGFELACVWPAREGARTEQPIEWVRTVDGWERASQWRLAPPPSGGRLHPAIVATFELLAALLVLVAYSRDPNRDPQRSSGPVSD